MQRSICPPASVSPHCDASPLSIPTIRLSARARADLAGVQSRQRGIALLQHHALIGHSPQLRHATWRWPLLQSPQQAAERQLLASLSAWPGLRRSRGRHVECSSRLRSEWGGEMREERGGRERRAEGKRGGYAHDDRGSKGNHREDNDDDDEDDDDDEYEGRGDMNGFSTEMRSNRGLQHQPGRGGQAAVSERRDRGGQQVGSRGGEGGRGRVVGQGERVTRAAVFWDLDNKQPQYVEPKEAALRLKDLASNFGEVVDCLAYANRHAFDYVPPWVREERKERRREQQLELQGMVVREGGHVCSLCGRRCKTAVELQKHFKQLHQREHSKRMNHLNTLSPTRKRRLREKYRDKLDRYREAAKNLLTPKRGYGLMPELRRAGVVVRLVSSAPQAADEALKFDMQRAITSRQVDTICLVSDDRGYSSMLQLARSRNLRVVVVGESTSLQGYADAWFSWDDVATGRALRGARSFGSNWAEREALARELREIDDDEDNTVRHVEKRVRSNFRERRQDDGDAREDVFIPSVEKRFSFFGDEEVSDDAFGEDDLEEDDFWEGDEELHLPANKQIAAHSSDKSSLY